MIYVSVISGSLYTLVDTICDGELSLRKCASQISGVAPGKPDFRREPLTGKFAANDSQSLLEARLTLHWNGTKAGIDAIETDHHDKLDSEFAIHKTNRSDIIWMLDVDLRSRRNSTVIVDGTPDAATWFTAALSAPISSVAWSRTVNPLATGSAKCGRTAISKWQTLLPPYSKRDGSRTSNWPASCSCMRIKAFSKSSMRCRMPTTGPTIAANDSPPIATMVIFRNLHLRLR